MQWRNRKSRHHGPSQEAAVKPCSAAGSANIRWIVNCEDICQELQTGTGLAEIEHLTQDDMSFRFIQVKHI